MLLSKRILGKFLRIVETVKLLFAILDARTIWLLVGVFFSTICVVGAEYIFAYALQACLLSIGAQAGGIQMSTGRLAELVFAIGPATVLGISGCVRTLANFIGVFLTGACNEYFVYSVRQRLIDQFSDRSRRWSRSESILYFNELASKSGQVVISISKVLSSSSLSIGLAAALLFTNFQLFQWSMMVAFFGLLLVGMLNPILARVGLRIMRQWRHLLENLDRYITHQLFLNAVGAESLEKGKLKSGLREILKFSLLGRGLNEAPNAFISIFAIVFLVFVIVKASTLESPGTIPAFLFLFLRLIQSVAELGRGISLFAEHDAAISMMANRLSNIKSQDYLYQIEACSVMEKDALVELENISFYYSRTNKDFIIRNISLQIYRGSVIFVEGSSGSGKSTLLGIVLGLLVPSAGEVRRKNGLTFGYVGPEPVIIPGTIMENLAYTINQPISADFASTILRDLGLGIPYSHSSISSDFLLDSPASELSQGQKQRICLAREIIRSPDVLILDEATANLDRESEKLISNWICENKSRFAILMTGHRSALVEIADKVLRL